MSTSQNKLRVLQVTPQFFPFIGGVETHVHEVGRRLVEMGVEVTVLTTDRQGTLPKSELHEGIRVHRIPAWPARQDYFFAPAIFRVIATGGWDIVHCQGSHTLVAPMAMFAAQRARVPYVVTFHTGGHSSRLRTMARGAQWSSLRPLFRGAHRLIGVSEFEVESFHRQLRIPRERFALIPNGGKLPEVSAPPQPLPQPRHKLTRDALIVSIGRLERYKGHHRVLAALPKVLDHWPRARLLILGSGPYEQALRSRAKRLGVAHSVEIRAIPPGDRGAMAQLLAQADLVTLLSDYEAHPVAVMEALALRRPMLVTEASGLRQFAEEGLARSVPLNSAPSQVAAAILDQLQDPLIPGPVALPTWEDNAAALLAVYKSAVRSVACAS